MIISHKHNFIFIKTTKTAGTSLEIALSRFCGDDDIITPITEEYLRKRHGGRGPQNYLVPFRKLSMTNKARYLRRSPTPMKFFNHKPAEAVRETMPDDIWRSYLKFTIVRNPWDRLVSRFYWSTRDQREALPFYEWIIKHPFHVNENWPLYTDGRKVLVDRCLRFEDLALEASKISQMLALPEDIGKSMENIRAKSEHRKSQKSEDRNFFGSTKIRRLVEILAENEIREFDYAMPAKFATGERAATAGEGG